MKIVYKINKDVINIFDLYLFKYLEYKKINFQSIVYTEGFDFSNIDYFLISYFNYEDIFDIINITNIKRSLNLKFKIIIGGPILNDIYDIDQFIDLFPEINHIVYGRGEEALYDIIINSTDKKILFDKDYQVDKEFIYSTPFIVKNEKPSIFNESCCEMGVISLSHNICSWNKCKFCSVMESNNRFVMKFDRIIEKIKKMYYENNIRLFMFYDNLIQFDMLKNILLELVELKDIKLIFFGMKADKRYLELKPIIEQYNSNPIKMMVVGLEFYHQDVLDKIDKGITLEDIDKTAKFCFDNTINLKFHVIIGLPLVRHEHVDFFINWINSNDLKSTLAIHFLKLNKENKIFKEKDFFGIIPLEHLSLYDMIEEKNTDLELIKKIKIKVIDFLYKNTEYNKIMTRQEVYDTYYSKTILKTSHL